MKENSQLKYEEKHKGREVERHISVLDSNGLGGTESALVAQVGN